MSNVEVAYHYHQPSPHEQVGGCLYVSGRELGEAAGRVERDFDVELTDGVHQYQGADEKTISFDDLATVRLLLADADVARALRGRTAMLMTDGQVPGMQRRWHNAALGAVVLG